MSEVAARELTLVRRGTRYEARFFTQTILADSAAARLRVIKEDDGSPFIYPIVYSPIAGENRDDRTLEYFGTTPPAVLDALRNGRGLFVIDHSNEGFEPKRQALHVIHDRIAALGIPPRRVMFLTQNVRFEDRYEDWRRRLGSDAPERFNVGIYHCFLRQMSTYAARELIPSGEFAKRRQAHGAAIEAGAARPKRFLCLNFTPRGHRLATMLHIMQHGLEERGHISFPGLANRKLSIAGRTEDLLEKQPFPDLPALRALLPTLEGQPPRQLDTDPFARISPVIDVGQWWYYAETHFSLVTESGVHAKGHERFTEKPFKAVLGLHPFLILGLPRTLALMRDYGFRSFAPHFDESYDAMDRDEDRVAAVLAEFRRLCALSDADWAKLGRDVSDAVRHNYEQFDGPLQRHFAERVEAPLLDRMAALAAPDRT